jgi:hypothetical protein
VAAPPLAAVGALLERNRRAFAAAPPLLGHDLAGLRERARAEALQTARRYLERHGEQAPPVDASAPLLLAGHQPELYHPGVWVKSFVLRGLARRHGRTPLNLVIDGDAAKSADLLLPPPPGHLTARPVAQPFDRWPGGLPYEEWEVGDWRLFESFGERACEALAGWGYRPLLADLWPEVLRRPHAEQRCVGDRIASARRAWERRWGCHNLEAPQSGLCASEAFALFAVHLLGELPRFRVAHNEAVQAYRRREHIRSPSHPMPDLSADGDWLEAPFWGWRAGRRRHRLFVRLGPDRIELRVGGEAWPTLPRSSAERLAAAWQALEGQGLKVRTRALTTTLFARLFLAELFIHGIGGGKYDEVTDDVLRRFYGVAPPGVLIVSATRLLPLRPYPSGPADVRRLQREARDLHWAPQRFGAADAALAEERRHWAEATPRTKEERRERFRRLRELTEALRAPLAGREEEVRQRLAVARLEAAANAALRRRDYSFCLHPEEGLRPFLTRFLDI